MDRASVNMNRVRKSIPSGPYIKSEVSIPTFLIFALVLFSTMLAFLEHTEENFKAIMGGILFALSLPILASWFLWGIGGGITVVVISSLACLIVSIAMGTAVYLANLFLFLSTGLIGYGLLEKEKKLRYQGERRLEQVQESKNTLQFEHGRHKLAGEAMRSRINRYLMLREVAQALTSSLDFVKTATLVTQKTLEVIGKEGPCLLYLADVEGQKLALKSSWKSKITAKTGDVFDVWVVKQGQVLLVENVEKDFRFRLDDAELRRRKVSSLISAPLVSGERIIGVLRVDSEKPNTFLTDDLRLLSVLADLAAVAVENAQLYHRTEELAITDGLTQLYVHRHFLERLEQELRRAVRSHSFLSLLMIDIDHFKNYNDKYGHSTGDIVLKKVSGILKEKAGNGSIVARYGGEEFSIVLPRTDKKPACEVAESIRKTIAKESITVRREKTNITISVGVATFPADAAAREDIIRRADEALLQAKREGRNRVCIA